MSLSMRCHRIIGSDWRLASYSVEHCNRARIVHTLRLHFITANRTAIPNRNLHFNCNTAIFIKLAFFSRSISLSTSVSSSSSLSTLSSSSSSSSLHLHTAQVWQIVCHLLYGQNCSTIHTLQRHALINNSYVQHNK